MGFQTEKPFVLEEVTETDLTIALLIFGWTMGFGYFTVVHSWRQTHRLNTWSILVWGEVAVCFGFAIECILYLEGVIQHSFIFYFTILTLWALQVQLLLQIIINRICMLWSNERHKFWLKWGVAIWITSINLSVYCIWIPARLQISERYIHINDYWDRTEKILYAITDAILNGLFITTVQRRLVAYGLTKYDRLVRFNKQIITISLAMDIFIIAMMSFPNSFVYMQVHPLAYITKLNIELSMGSLIVSIAKETRGNSFSESADGVKQSIARGVTMNVVTNVVEERDGQDGRPGLPQNPVGAYRTSVEAHRDGTGRIRPHEGARAHVRLQGFPPATPAPVVLNRNPFHRNVSDDAALEKGEMGQFDAFDEKVYALGQEDSGASSRSPSMKNGEHDGVELEDIVHHVRKP